VNDGILSNYSRNKPSILWCNQGKNVKGGLCGAKKMNENRGSERH